MSAYFFNMNPNERENILKQHQTVYDGYAVRESSPKENPIIVQDFANDKNGITVNGKGDVKHYTNVGIHESVIREEKEMCSECGGMMYEGECSECGYGGDDMVMIADLGEDIDDGEVYDYADAAFDYKSGGPEQFSDSDSDVDPYDLDLQSIQSMFDDADIHGDGDTGDFMMALQNKMDNEFDGKEKMSGEWGPYNFDSEGPEDGYGYAEVAEETDSEGIELPSGTIIMSPSLKEETCEKCGKEICECWMSEEVDEDLQESFKEQKNKINEMFSRFNKYN